VLYFCVINDDDYNCGSAYGMSKPVQWHFQVNSTKNATANQCWPSVSTVKKYRILKLSYFASAAVAVDSSHMTTS